MAFVIDNRYWNNDLTVKNNNNGMDLMGIGTAVSGIAGAIGTGVAANKNLKAVRETNAANLALAREQNDWNMMMWNKENEYNSPAAKLARLQAAGLNPLFYGLDGAGTASSLQSADLANQQAPQLDAGAIGSSMSNLTSSLFNAAQIEIQKKQIALRDKELDIRDRELAAKIPGYTAVAEKDTEAAKLLAKQAANEEKRGKIMDQEYDNAVKDGVIKDNQAAVLKAQKDNIIKATQLVEEQITTEKSKQALNYGLTNEAYSRAKLNDAERKTIDAVREDTVRKAAAEADIAENEAKEIIERINLIVAQTDKTKVDAELARLEVELTKRYGDAERVAKIFAVASQGIENLVDAGVKLAGAIVTGGASGALQSSGSNSSPVYKSQTSRSDQYGWNQSPNSPVNTVINPW